MNQREIDEMHDYLKEFTSEVLTCGSNFREKNTIYASFTYYPEFQKNFYYHIVMKTILLNMWMIMVIRYLKMN